MKEHKDIELRPLEDILGESSPERYEIPIYQRNYAWGTAELNQLLQDIWDSAQLNQDGVAAHKYYLGTLVLFPKGDDVYEVVDGQQRLTTLHLIMCALKNKLPKDAGLDFSWYKSGSGISSPKLSFSFRQSATRCLEALYNGSDTDLDTAPAMSSNYDKVIHQLKTLGILNPSKDGHNVSLNRFYQYFRSSTLLAVTYLPPETDLNHYFEVMNSRGEQLEKHEILKARLINYLKDESDPDKSRLAKLIWEACADLSRYVQMNFTPDLRKVLFSENWNEFKWKNFDELLLAFKQPRPDSQQEPQPNQSRMSLSLSDILDDSSINAAAPKPEEEKEELFYSVIDFPNFLLQVLRVMTEENTALDDKQLLEQFDKKMLDEWSIKHKENFAQKFIFELLRLRFLYDKYVIKYALTSGTDVKWQIRSLKKDQSSSSYRLYSSCKEDDNRFITPRVVMAQLMFHVSLPSRSYKHWLTGVLHYVSSESDPSAGLADYLERLARSYMLDHFLSGKKADDNDYYKIIFNNDDSSAQQESNSLNLPKYTDGINFFIFNYLDYHLWKLCCLEKAQAQLNLTDAEQKAVCQFVFTQRSSIEHFYPQHPLSGDKLNDEILHSFGNLCLISQSRNSKFSNYSPAAKIENWSQDKKIDSIKLYLMMTAAQRNLNENKPAWTEEDIKHHQEQMEEVLSDSFKVQPPETKA